MVRKSTIKGKENIGGKDTSRKVTGKC